jgi:dolichyl-phosphate-mannose--protein O-mannosyl transferase
VTATLQAPAEPHLSADDEASEPPAPPAPVAASLRPWHDPSPLIGWAIMAVVTAVAAFTRFWALGWPHGKQFDEVYYATEAQEMLRFGYEDNRGYGFIVHPPLGKWLIGISSYFYGNNELGWRVAPAVAGVLVVIMITRTARRMFRSNLFGGIAGLLMALEGMSVVLSRVALLDIFLQLFVVAGFAALVCDRDQMRGRLARLLADGGDISDRVPTLGPRPWRLVGGIMLGAACAVKWSALSFFVAFALLSLFWDRSALKAAGVRKSWRWAARRSLPGGAGTLLVAPVATYLFCWLGWFAGEVAWDRHWAASHSSSARLNLFGIRIPFNWGFLPGAIRSLGAFHLDAYRFHEGLSSYHPYRSNPWNWLILGRPVLLTYNMTPDGADGHKTCGAAKCVNSLLLIGTPLLWWAFVPMLLWLAWHWVTTRDWRAGAVWVAFVAGWVVWFQDTKRTMFLFYMAPLVPFLILGLTLALGTMLGRAAPTALSGIAAWTANRRRFWGLLGVTGFLGLVIADFAWMWPLFTAGTLTYDQWHAHMWFPSWV